MQQNKPGNEILSTSSVSNLNQSQNSSSLSPSLPAAVAPVPMTTSNTITTTSDTSNVAGATANSEANNTAPTVASATSAASSTATGTASSSSVKSNGGAFDTKWIFPADKIINSPSRADGITYEDELTQRQESALFITDLGHMLKRNQLAINTAIIYMHRFYMVHSFKKFQRYMVASACLFFACKVEEQPLRLREFIEAIHLLLHKANHPHAYSDQDMRKYGDEIVALESCLIQTLGFNVCINHAHTIIIKTCQMIKAPRDLAEAAYLTATNSLMLTDFCVKFSPEKVACFCIYLACKWTGMIIPTSSEGFQWYQYVQANMTELELEDASKEYVEIYDKCPPRVHRKLGRYKEKNEPTEANEPSSASTTASTTVSSSTPASRPSASQQQAIKQEPQVPSTSVVNAPPTSTGSSSSHNASHTNTHSSSGHSRPHHQPYPHPNQSQYHSNHHHQNQHHYQQPHRGHQSGRPHHGGPTGSRHPPPPSGSHHHQPHQSSQHHQQQQQPNTSREFSQDS